MAGSQTSRPTLGLVLIRVAIGVVLLMHGWSAVHGGGVDGDAVRDVVHGTLSGAPEPIAWWGQNVLLSNPEGVAFLWRWAALVCGLGLALGALTRPAGLLAGFFALNAFLFVEGPERLTVGLVAVCCLACALSRAGRRLGLDTMFDQHFSPWITWTRRRETVFP
ncbi:MAG: DoxX family protein [Planctomycetota bacterium]|nr:DoxX family protein [Planctomycetota bacterium]